MNTSQEIKMQMVDDNVGNQVRQNVVQNDGRSWGKMLVRIDYSDCCNYDGLVLFQKFGKKTSMGMECCYTIRNEGNGNGINGKSDKIAQEEEAGIQSTQEEFEFMAAADAYEETE
ncbi:hypothetical protein Tco_1525622 [Tanacetum coccineum]